MSSLKIVHIVDDNEALRETLAVSLRISSYHVEDHSSGAVFLERLSSLSPGCILLDMQMPNISGLNVLEALKERKCHWPVIMLTAYGEVSLAVRAMRLGAADFIEKPYRMEEVCVALEREFDLLRANTESSATRRAAIRLIERLSARELQVLQGMTGNMPNKVIANQVGLSVRTVENYRSSVMAKLEVKGTAAAIRIALATGVQPLVSGDPKH